MFKDKHTIKYFVVSILFFAVIYTTLAIGILDNPNFSIYDFFLNLASELVGLFITVLIVDTYLRMKGQNLQAYRERRRKKEAVQAGVDVTNATENDGAAAVADTVAGGADAATDETGALAALAAAEDSGFEVLGGEGVVKSVATVRDKATGIQYLLVVHAHGSGLTPLLDEDGKPVVRK